jgi:hypothetical protein
LPAGIVLVVEAKRGRKAVGRVAADSFPANKVAIAAAFGVNEETEDRVDAQGLEEILGGAGCQAAGPVLLAFGLVRDVGEDFQFLLFRGGRKARNTGEEFIGGFLRRFKTSLINGQGFAEKGFQGAVDEVNDAGFARAGGFTGGDDARGEGFDFARLVGRENFERGMSRFCGLMGVFRGGNERRPICGQPGGAGGASEELQKITACRMERVHVPPIVQPIYELRVMASTRNPRALLLIWPV